jgi:hypothetical protein
MLPNFLFPESEVQKDGEGTVVPLGDAAGKTIQLTLGITDAVEQESLEVSIFGSADGTAWTPKPIISFPQKFYKGVYTILLDLSQTPDVQFLKLKYKTGRWGHWTSGPQFRFYVFAEILNA